MAERGQVDEVAKLLVAPDVVSPSLWRGGTLRLGKPAPPMPRDFYFGLPTPPRGRDRLFVHTHAVPPDAIKSWKDLLEPEYRGKIAAHDPRIAGPGLTQVGYLAFLFGDQFVKALYASQEVVLTADTRQLAEWVGRGTYPI